MKKFFRAYFDFNKGERTFIYVLFFLIACSLILRYGLEHYGHNDEYIYSSEVEDRLARFLENEEKAKDAYFDSLKQIGESNLYELKSPKRKFKPFKLSPEPFDPNTLDHTQAKRIGIAPYIVDNIQSYLSKGGTIYSKEKFSETYGLEDSVYQILKPYILLPETRELASIEEKTFKKKTKKPYSKQPKYKSKPKKKVNVNLNLASIEDLKSINGIGEVFSERIFKYRERLGGFIEKTQLKEVYGLTDSTYSVIEDQISLDASITIKLPINYADYKTLSAHPYITSKQANAILKYKEQHDSFTDIKDLKRIYILDNEWLEKIEPYLNFQK